MNYRKDIDGLRAIAVLSVVFYHGNITYFNGGYIGVDIFFVISGYLISSIIIKDIEKNKFNLINFYNRRARRILPALFLVIFVSNILAFIILTRTELAFYMESSLSGIFFYSNFFFWKNVSYFAADSEFHPLLHLWSLSIEEQFYLIFPFFLIIAYKINKKIIFPILLIVFFLSISFSQWTLINNHKAANFYLTISRAWEILAGVIAGYILHFKNINLSIFIRNILSLTSFTGIFLCILLFPNDAPVASILLLAPIIFTVILIISINNRCSLYTILSNKFLATIGLMSYSIYLWHQPLFAFSKTVFKKNDIYLTIIIILITILLSFFSWFYIERKFRDKIKINNKSLYSYFATFSFILILFGLNFFHFKKNSDEKIYAKFLLKNNVVELINFDDRILARNRIAYDDKDQRSIAIGSSRIMQINDSLDKNKIINYAVNGAVLNDIIPLTLMSLEKFNIEELYIGIDPWIINKTHLPLSWKSLQNELSKSIDQIKKMKKKNNLLEYAKNEVDYQNFYEKKIENVYKYLNLNKLQKASFDKNNSNRILILRDGRRVYPHKDKKFTPRMTTYNMESFEFSEDKFNLFEKFILFLKDQHDIKIYFVFTPYHPVSFIKSIEKFPEYQKIELQFKNFAKRNNIVTIGSYDSRNTNCSENNFLDDYHPNDYCMNKLINAIKEN